MLGEAFHRRVASEVAEYLASNQKHAALLFDPANVRYLTGVRLAATDRPVAACVWTDGRVALLVPFLEAEHAANGWVRDIRWYHESTADEQPVDWMVREAGTPLIVDDLSAENWIRIASEEIQLADPLAKLRMIKSPVEIDLIARAAEYADLALERTFARLTVGSSEQEVRADVVNAVDAMMREQLGELYEPAGGALTGTIHSGTRASYPNALASGRRLSRGDTAIAEFTASVGGYHAKAGCTFFVGDPLRDVVRWVEASMSAQAAAREAMTIGASADAIDAAARRTLERNGLGNAIRHRTGQGIGLDVAEPPFLTRGDTTSLVPGMVLVNQPGAYVTGRTGARNSETLVIEEDGVRLMNPRLERWANLEARLKEF